MPSDVDDLRIRKYRCDQTDMAEICGHLVREMGTRKFAISTGALQVFLAKGIEFIRIESARRSLIGPLKVLRFEGSECRNEGRQLSASFNHRMARKNLLDQC